MLLNTKNNLNNNNAHLEVLEGGLCKVVNDKVRCNKDGSIDKRHSNKAPGVSSEVYAFNTNEEIKAMINAFNHRIYEAPDENKKQIAYRNKLLFLIGINLSLRISDLITLKWNFFLKNDMTFRDFYKIQPKKTKKTGKYVTLYFNETIKRAIMSYIEQYPIENMNDFIFKSRKGKGAISEGSVWKIIVDTARDAGIDKNVGTHSLRKTFGFWAWHNAQDKNKALVTLQMIFNHSTTTTTMRYIGLLNSEIEEMFNSVDLGLDYL